jgi:protein disulfide-isomerase
MMKTIRWIIGAALLTATATVSGSVEFDAEGAVPGKWTMDLDAAKKLAAEKKLPILMDFSGSDWCGWCKVMEENVFTKPEWKTYAQENLVMVFLDYPRDKSLVPGMYVERNDALKKEYGVTGYPTFVVLDDDGETELGRLKSGRDKTPGSFQGELQQLFRYRPVEIEKLCANLPPENADAYRRLIEKRIADQEELGVAKSDYWKARNEMNRLSRSIEDTEYELLKLRVTQLSEAGRKQFEELEAQLEEAQKKRSDWFKSKPEPTDENKAKYNAMNDEIKRLEKEIADY